MGIAGGIVRAVENAAEQAGKSTVEAVQVRIGTLSGCVPEALTACWALATEGTRLDGARLDLEVVQAAVWCPRCDAERPIDEFFALACPVCRTPTAQLVRGSDLEVVSADLD